jgi:glucosamine--fructose-6-phosphate aminotransferase (isomerizing)
MMSFRAGVEAQPENLRLGAQLMQEALREHDLAPLREGTVVFSGIGASWHALAPAVRALRAAGRRAFAVPAVELARTRDLAEAYVLVSQSGASRELLDALDVLDGREVYGVSAHPGGPLAAAATRSLPLGPIADTPISTLAYTSTLQALALLCEALLGATANADLARLPDAVQRAIAEHDAAAAELAPLLAGAVAVDAVGAGASVASAGEAALLVREALRTPAYGVETREYLHGPLEAVGEGFACLLFGGRRELELATALRSYGAAVCTIGEVGDVPGFALPVAIERARVVLEIVPVQLLVAHAAELLGLELDALRRTQADTKVPT